MPTRDALDFLPGGDVQQRRTGAEDIDFMTIIEQPDRIMALT